MAEKPPAAGPAETPSDHAAPGEAAAAPRPAGEAAVAPRPTGEGAAVAAPDGAADQGTAPPLDVDADARRAERGAEGAEPPEPTEAGGAGEGQALSVPAAPDGSDTLLRAGLLSEAQVREVVGHQNRTGLGFDAAALALGLATADDLRTARARLSRGIAVGLQPAGRVSDEVVVVSDPASPRAESIRLLRTQIIAQHLSAGRRAFAVASPAAGAGVTFIAANLAAALAQVGIKTLLVDSNLRDPRVDTIFGLEPGGPGLTTFLGLQAGRPERIVYPDVLPNLSVIPSGPAVARPQELLSGARFRAGVDILLREFDIAIFDTPPANESADALTVAGVIGYALLVARRHTSYVRDVQVLADQLAAARASVIGSVLNVYP